MPDEPRGSMGGTGGSPEHRPADRGGGRLRRATAWPSVGLGLLLALTPVPDAAAVRIGGPFALVDQHGAARTDADFRGSYLLIYFGFTNCPDSCPTALAKITDALTELDAAKAARVVPMFVSIDPARDTPEVLRGYAEHFDPRLVTLTGTPRALAEVGRAYGVFAAKVPTGDAGGYVMDHTSFLYLIGPDGDYVRHFESDVGFDELLGALRQSVVGPSTGGG